ncbi:MAG: hypothetical protein OEN55_05950 [Alphaproteobacteria bacterium]|nr:hypothetical protein [Alphaproteobacteria bacterium]
MAAQGLQGFFAAHGLHGFFAAQGLHGFLAAQGLALTSLAQHGLHGFWTQAEQGLAAAQGLLPADQAGTAMAMAAAATPAARVAFRVLALWMGISLSPGV